MDNVHQIRKVIFDDYMAAKNSLELLGSVEWECKDLKKQKEILKEQKLIQSRITLKLDKEL